MTTTNTLACWTDTSEFQISIYTNQYGHRIAMFRCMDGTSYLDHKFKGSLAWCKLAYQMGWIDMYFVYFVYRTNGASALYRAWTTALGPLQDGMALAIDVERWGGQITGNRSVDINSLFGMLAAYTKLYSRVVGYANKGDFDALWPNRDARCWVIVADYTNRWEFKSVFHAFAQQYTNGEYAGPAGYHSACLPFGKCDHNGAPDYTSKTLANKILGTKPPVVLPPLPPKPTTVAKEPELIIVRNTTDMQETLIGLPKSVHLLDSASVQALLDTQEVKLATVTKRDFDNLTASANVDPDNPGIEALLKQLITLLTPTHLDPSMTAEAISVGPLKLVGSGQLTFTQVPEEGATP